MENEEQKVMRSTQLLRSFWHVQKNIMRLVQKTAVENGLSIPQYTVLMTITLHKEMTQKKVGEKTFLPKSTLSQAVDGLVRAGLLHRQQVEGNRREMQLAITEKGEALLKTIHLQEGGIHQLFQFVSELMTDKQYEELLETHLQITNYLEAKIVEQGGETK
ncbi:MarR family winged helix-turn-helix transcriptional regulator [Aneurinibacillus uraniidurans]|uniref:MarR family winged helix-turn-helix transcriptional regulator n=1 Tax=Aneurinibacillus uraniidurans TaxID=2966586 RepID=UPI00234B3CDA|nr:MarR family transcriptional regulator [Aneurinibacillus sp. B1]WCN36281.1 MarR family transcriptional regulator [Aneurinibacillus sp. B1]